MSVRIERKPCMCCKEMVKHVYERQLNNKVWRLCGECLESMWWTQASLGIPSYDRMAGIPKVESDSLELVAA